MIFIYIISEYMVLHFITMSCLPVLWVNMSVYTNEMFEPKWRLLTFVFGLVPYHAFILVLIVYMSRTWTGIHVICGILSIVCIVPLWFLIPESPRWLAQNNHEEEAMKILCKMAKTNGKTLSSDDESQMRKVVCEIASQSHITEDSLTPLDMFRHGQALKSVILCFAWIMTCVSFYALGLNSSDLSGNIIMNFFLARLVGIGDGGYVLLTANYIGRRRSLGIAHFIWRGLPTYSSILYVDHHGLDYILYYTIETT